MAPRMKNATARSAKGRRGVHQGETEWAAQGTTVQHDNVDGADSATFTADNENDSDSVIVPCDPLLSVDGGIPVEIQGRGSLPLVDSDGSGTIDTPPHESGHLHQTANDDEDYAAMPVLIPVGEQDDDEIDDDDDDGPPPLERVPIEEGMRVQDEDSDDDEGPPPLEPALDDVAAPMPDDIINPGYIPDAVVQRLLGFTDFNDIGGGRFSLTHVPDSCAWGTASPGDFGLSKLLCYEGKPASIWLIGRVTNLWFYNLGGEPHDKVNIAVTPLREVDALAADRLINNHCNPVENTSYNTLYAGKLMMNRSKGELKVTPAPFNKVYDAVHQFGPKSTMRKISPVVLGEHDIVLVECFLSRWKAPEIAKRHRAWTTWRCGFQLNAISLLFSAPDTTNDIDLDLDEETAFM